MKWPLRVIPICAALVFAPAYGADDQQAAQRPSAATTPTAPSCPMMNGQMANGQMTGGQMPMAGRGMSAGMSGAQGKGAATGGSGMMGGAGQSAPGPNGGMSGMMTGQGQMGAGRQCPHMSTPTQSGQDAQPQGGGDQHAQHHPASN